MRVVLVIQGIGDYTQIDETVIHQQVSHGQPSHVLPTAQVGLHPYTQTSCCLPHILDYDRVPATPIGISELMLFESHDGQGS